MKYKIGIKISEICPPRYFEFSWSLRVFLLALDPIFDLYHIDLTIINDTSITLELNENSYNFDNGTVTAYNSNGQFVVEASFSRLQFPINLYNLATDSIFNLTFTFSIGTQGNCENGGIKTSEHFSLLYTPPGNDFFSETILKQAISIHLLCFEFCHLRLLVTVQQQNLVK